MRTLTPRNPSSARRTDFWRKVLARRERLSVLYASKPLERVALVKGGIPAALLAIIAEDMEIPRDKLYGTLGLPRATGNRKLRKKQMLSQDEGERVFGLARLVGQVDTMVKESGEPEGFDAAKWVATWLDRPQPALAGKRPAELMDTAEGRGIVSDMVARMQSGAYS